jgi:hypothetical protein
VEAVQVEQEPLRGRETGSQPWDVAGHSFWWRNDTPQEPRKGKNRKGQRGPGRYRRVA